MTAPADAWPDIPTGFLTHAVANLSEGVTIARMTGTASELVFVNRAFERLTGYRAGEMLGVDCRLLQRGDSDQPGVHQLRASIAAGRACTVTVRNYRRDGSMFWNELSLSPLEDGGGAVTHYIGIQKDVTSTVDLQAALEARNGDLERMTEMLAHLALTDTLTALYNRRFFDEQLALAFAAGLRERRTVAIFMIDIDHFKTYNDDFGHLSGDEALRSVAQCIRATYARAVDIVCRYGGEEFAVVASDLGPDQADQLAAALRERVAQLGPRGRADAPLLRAVTVSVGYAIGRPADGHIAGDVLTEADANLYVAKRGGRDRCVGSVFGQE